MLSLASEQVQVQAKYKTKIIEKGDTLPKNDKYFLDKFTLIVQVHNKKQKQKQNQNQNKTTKIKNKKMQKIKLNFFLSNNNNPLCIRI